MTGPKKSPAELAGFTPVRPWRSEPQKLFSLLLGKKASAAETSIGWAVFDLSRDEVKDEGEIVFRSDQTDDQKVAEAVAHYRARRANLTDEEAMKPHRVRLYRYSSGSFRASKAFSEGMTIKQHQRQLVKLANALRREGAIIEYEDVV